MLPKIISTRAVPCLALAVSITGVRLSRDSCNFDHQGLDQMHHQRGTMDHTPSSAAERCPFQSKAVGEIVSFDLHSALDLIPAANRLIPRVYSAKLNESSWCRQRPCWLRACGRRGGLGWEPGAPQSELRILAMLRCCWRPWGGSSVGAWVLCRVGAGERCCRAAFPHLLRRRSTSETRAAPEIEVHLMRLKFRHSSISGVAGAPVKEIGVFWG